MKKTAIILFCFVFVFFLFSCGITYEELETEREREYQLGYGKGYSEGYDEGYDEGHSDGFYDGYTSRSSSSNSNNSFEENRDYLISKYGLNEPESGTILSGSEYYGSEITVTASGSSSYVVKLKTVSGSEVVCFYIRAGETVTISVPLEYLYVYFAAGETWYGEDLLFGEDTTYSKDDEMLNFEEYSWEYTLYPVVNGNFSETPIDANEF